jgi:hypothetical protein
MEYNIKRESKMNINDRRRSSGMSEVPHDDSDLAQAGRPDWIDEMGRVDVNRTTNAMVWAEEFVHVISMSPQANPHDVSFMVGWFANAIETGRMAGRDSEIQRDFMDKLHEIIYQAVGAATVPMMQDHPDYVFPSERVKEAVEGCLVKLGIPPREGYGG